MKYSCYLATGAAALILAMPGTSLAGHGHGHGGHGSPHSHHSHHHYGHYGLGWPGSWGYRTYPRYSSLTQMAPFSVHVQYALARRGYYHGAIDGIVGPQTRRAIQSYQRNNRLPVTGTHTDSTLLRSLGLR